MAKESIKLPEPSKDKPTALPVSPFPDQEIVAFGLAKVPNAKGKFQNYKIYIKNNQITKITYGTPDYKEIATNECTTDFVHTLIVGEQ